MRRLLYPLIFLILLANCAAPTPAPISTEIPTATSTHTPRPTNTPTETPTITPSPTPEPVEIPVQLFFDMNGSGLRDEATFVYEKDFFVPEKYQGRPELYNAVEAMGEVPDGQLLTIPEPALYDGLEVCLGVECVAPDEQGKVTFIRAADKIGSTAKIEIKDLNADVPWLALRYMNLYKGPVVVPEYTVDVGPSVMNTLEIILGCESTEELVCKLDEDTLLVRDQHLNDTEIQGIDKEVRIQTGPGNEVGLMQGFLTLPFVKEQIPKPFIWNYFDIIGYRIFDEEHTYFSTQDGTMLNYDGHFSDAIHGPDFYRLRKLEQIDGVSDSHTGLDYLIPVGRILVSGAPLSNVWFNPEGQINLLVNIDSVDFDNCYGHMSVPIVSLNNRVYRNQIIGLSGDRGDPSPFPSIPQLHFHIAQATPNGWHYLDPYRYTVELDPLPENFWGNPVSMWTSDNNPIFSLSDMPNQ